jgi:hypothetical protein
MRNVVKLLVALTMLGSGTAANAAVIYDNGITATNGFVSDTDFPMFVADDFKLNPGANVITDVHWTGFYAFTNTPLQDAFTIQFFADAGGLPALAPFLSLSVSPSRTDTGKDVAGSDLFAYDVVIAPLALAPNTTFWLSIFNNTSGDANDNWFWGMVDNGGNSFNRASPADPWLTQGNGQEFQLTGVVPQPSALALFAFGIFGLAVYVRKKRSKGSAPISVHT